MNLTVKMKVEGLNRLKQAIDTMQAAIKEIESAAAEVTFTVENVEGKDNS